MIRDNGHPKTVVVAMSGGVDSSVAAALLVEAGYKVIGVTLRLWSDPEAGAPGLRRCCSLDDAEDARRVCQHLGIPFYYLNFEAPFLRHVVEPFCREYARGRTPNPCLACNQHIKFRALLDRVLAWGADYLATGHYAAIAHREGHYHLLESRDKSKDQSYVLYTLGQTELAHLLFPVGGYAKTQVRAMAAERGLPVARKPDSQEICFAPGGYRGFLDEYPYTHSGVPLSLDGGPPDVPLAKGDSGGEARPWQRPASPSHTLSPSRGERGLLSSLVVPISRMTYGPGHLISQESQPNVNVRSWNKAGPVVDTSGRTLGEHRGLAGYTVGQRRRLGLAWGKGSETQPYYVVRLEPDINTLVVGPESDLLADTLWASDLHLVSGEPLTAPLLCRARIRYRAPAAAATVVSQRAGAEVRFEVPQRAIAPGQAVVLYDGEEVLGGGTIERAWRTASVGLATAAS